MINLSPAAEFDLKTALDRIRNDDLKRIKALDEENEALKRSLSALGHRAHDLESALGKVQASANGYVEEVRALRRVAGKAKVLLEIEKAETIKNYTTSREALARTKTELDDALEVAAPYISDVY